jgi:hypothetical protein
MLETLSRCERKLGAPKDVKATPSRIASLQFMRSEITAVMYSSK